MYFHVMYVGVGLGFSWLVAIVRWHSFLGCPAGEEKQRSERLNDFPQDLFYVCV